MEMRSFIYRLVRVLGDMLYPGRCLACRRLFNRYGSEHLQVRYDATAGSTDVFGRIAAPYLCRSCRTAFFPADEPFCTCCGYVFESRQGQSHICPECRDHPKQFARARAFGIYAGSLKVLIQAFKYAAKRQLARPLGMLLLLAYNRHGLRDSNDLIVPVPLHRRRLRQRGFNQSALPLTYWPKLSRSQDRSFSESISVTVFERHRFTRPQASFGRQDRSVNIKDAFRVVESDRIAGQRILLVDDVYTTGATVNECARVLMHGGAAEVNVLTIARAL
jgi:ComF family protein